MLEGNVCFGKTCFVIDLYANLLGYIIYKILRVGSMMFTLSITQKPPTSWHRSHNGGMLAQRDALMGSTLETDLHKRRG